MEINALRNNILVKILPISNRMHKNLLVIPDTATDQNYYGIVEAVGQGARTKKGAIVPPMVSQGDMILFPRHTGTRIMVDNTEYRFLKSSEIIAVIEEE